MLQEQQERECPLIGSKLSESEVVDRLFFGSTKVTKYFNGFGNFEGTVIYACEYSTVTYFRVEWSDAYLEDLDATELLNFVDVATLAVERTEEKEMLNSADVTTLSVKSPREIEQEQRHNKKAQRQKPNLPPALPGIVHSTNIDWKKKFCPVKNGAKLGIFLQVQDRLVKKN